MSLKEDGATAYAHALQMWLYGGILLGGVDSYVAENLTENLTGFVSTAYN
jgi:hypothetical protein